MLTVALSHADTEEQFLNQCKISGMHWVCNSSRLKQMNYSGVELLSGHF